MLKIGELAKRVNVSVDTLRLYEKQGLIRSERLANGYRIFEPGNERVVNLIRQGQRLGFTLKEMSQIVCLLNQEDIPAEEVARLLEGKLSELDQKIAELTELRELLASMHSRACPLRSQT